MMDQSVIDDKQRDLLRQIFNKGQDPEDIVNAARFRVDHADNIPVLDEMERTQTYLIRERSGSTDTYRLRIIALPLLNLPEADLLLQDIEKLFDYLKEKYAENLSEPIRPQAICEKLQMGRSRLSDCITYLSDASVLGGSRDLELEGATVSPYERIVNFKDFFELMSWLHGVLMGPSDNVSKSKKPHGNTQVNASKREEILGAAIAVMTAFPDQCRRSPNGAFSGEKITGMIEDKAPIWWPDEQEPPMSHRAIAELINKHIRTLK